MACPHGLPALALYVLKSWRCLSGCALANPSLSSFPRKSIWLYDENMSPCSLACVVLQLSKSVGMKGNDSVATSSRPNHPFPSHPRHCGSLDQLVKRNRHVVPH
ncbi:hypothetical protein V8E52_003501 [Russula decolorans]